MKLESNELTFHADLVSSERLLALRLFAVSLDIWDHQSRPNATVRFQSRKARRLHLGTGSCIHQQLDSALFASSAPGAV